MRYISIDIETTGLNTIKHQILEFGAVIDDTDKPNVPIKNLPSFQRVILHDEIHGSPFAINMNQDLITMIAKPSEYPEITFCDLHELADEFLAWAKSYGIEGEFVAAGKNFDTFDSLFLNEIPSWKRNVRVFRRSFDPATSYFDPALDLKPPSLSECLGRAGEYGVVSHRAIDDAQAVIKVLRHKWKN